MTISYRISSVLINFLIVLTEYIVEVKEGQNSEGFDRYPYEEVKDQSLSVLIEGEIQGKLYAMFLPSS